MSAMAVAFQMREIHCGECGITFWAPEFWMAERQKDGKGFHCPNGHARVYRETDIAKLQKELMVERQKVAAEQQRVQLERSMRMDAEKAAESAKRKLKKTTRRIESGVCIHCNRTFKQLAAHMRCKHAEELCDA